MDGFCCIGISTIRSDVIIHDVVSQVWSPCGLSVGSLELVLSIPIDVLLYNSEQPSVRLEFMASGQVFEELEVLLKH